VITADLRRAITAAVGSDADPKLRPGPVPGSYAFRLSPNTNLAAALRREPWIATAEITGPGYLTVTVTHDALAALAVRIPQAGEACAASDALRGHTVPAPPQLNPDTWPQAQAALAAQLTPRLAAAAGATVIFDTERSSVSPTQDPPTPSSPVAAGIAYAGADEVRFALARMRPGGAAPEPAVVARHVLANPAYAVRYAHAAAAAVLRWAAALGTGPAGFRPGLLAEPGELALLDALSWLPERVAIAARRARPDVFAGYLEELAARTIDTMNTTGFTRISSISSERLWLADAARTGLAAGLGLLGVSAPDRL
jgi:arginyl-tRNA synthetase